MQNQSQATGTAETPFRDKPSSSDVDLRCALTLVRVALQTLADLNPEAAAAIDSALGCEIEAKRTKKDPETLAVIEVLVDVRRRLAGDDAHIISDDNAWYID